MADTDPHTERVRPATCAELTGSTVSDNPYSIEAEAVNDWMAPIAGGILVLVGLSLVAAHVRSHKRNQQQQDLDDAARSHLNSRYRRRMQASGMIAVLGVLIAVGDKLPILNKKPGLFAVYWIGVLLLTGWVMLLAMGDYVATRAHGRAALARLRKKQLELEQEIAEIKRRGSNGRDNRH